MRDHLKAADILKQLVDDDIVDPFFTSFALIFLCELLLEELSIYNNPEILAEINPLIEQLLKIAEYQNSYSWLAEGKLLQAKLALIQEKNEEATRLLTEAQQVAEEHGLNLFAQKISSEHDLLLEKIDEWDRLKKEDAPMADRIELASFDGVINRLQGKKAIEPMPK